MDVSVVVAVKNGAATLRQCIQSVLGQTGCDFEIIVIDALSDDGTRSIIDSLESPRLTCVREADRGIYDAWNKALVIARGRWCAFLGADDYLHEPHALADLLAVADAHPDGSVFVSGRHLLVEEGEEREVGDPIGDLSASLSLGELRSHVGALHRTDALRSIGGFDASFRTCGDLDALLRLVEVGTLWSTATLVATVRSGGLSTRHAGAVGLIRERRRILRRFHGPFAASMFAARPVIRRTLVRLIDRMLVPLFGRRVASRTLRALRRLRSG
jgi:glycosyltransferase involved in cell wall biosynthesis